MAAHSINTDFEDSIKYVRKYKRGPRSLSSGPTMTSADTDIHFYFQSLQHSQEAPYSSYVTCAVYEGSSNSFTIQQRATIKRRGAVKSNRYHEEPKKEKKKKTPFYKRPMFHIALLYILVILAICGALVPIAMKIVSKSNFNFNSSANGTTTATG